MLSRSLEDDSEAEIRPKVEGSEHCKHFPGSISLFSKWVRIVRSTGLSCSNLRSAKPHPTEPSVINDLFLHLTPREKLDAKDVRNSKNLEYARAVIDEKDKEAGQV